MTRYRPHKVPPKAHPLVKELLGLMNVHQVTKRAVALKAGIHVDSFDDWKYKCRPRIENLEACLGALGYELVVAPINSARPEGRETATGIERPSRDRHPHS